MKKYIIKLLLIFPFFGWSQNKTIWTKEAIETQFLQHNLELISFQYEISKAEAALIQAKLISNPTLSISEVNLWKNGSSENLPFLFNNFGNNQQVSIELEQLIETGKKRKKRMDLRTAELQQQQLEIIKRTRELLLDLRLYLLDLDVLQQKEEMLKQQLVTFEQLRVIYEKQAQIQNISKADYYRILSEYMVLKNEYLEFQSQKSELKQQIQTLMGKEFDSGFDYYPADYPFILSQKIPEEWQVVFETNAPDYLLAENNLRTTQKAWNLAKAEAVPDVILQINYDRGGNIMRDFVGVGIAVPLPFFNRNQGEIKRMEYDFSQKEQVMLQKQNEIKNNMFQLVHQLEYFESSLNAFDAHSLDEYEQMLSSYRKNLQAKNISLMEYIDFTQAYRGAMNSYKELENSYRKTFEKIQYTLGKDLK